MCKRLLSIIVVCCFTFGSLTMCRGALAQQPEGGGPNPRNATISVSSLRVPAKAWEHYRKARAAERAQRGEDCDKEVAKALAIAPGFPEARLLHAARLVVVGQYQAAIDEAWAIEQEDPALSWSAIVLASSYNGLRRYEDALIKLSTLPTPEAGTWQARYERARAEIGLNHAEGALHWSALALAAAPSNFPDVHLLRANALQVAGQWREASTEMEKYLALPHPPEHGAQVVAALAFTERRAQEQDAQSSSAGR